MLFAGFELFASDGWSVIDDDELEACPASADPLLDFPFAAELISEAAAETATGGIDTERIELKSTWGTVIALPSSLEEWASEFVRACERPLADPAA